MTAVAYALVFGAAVIHATWNRLLHGAADRPAAAAVGAVAASVLLLPGTLILPPWRVWPLILASGCAEALYFTFLSAAYRRGELSFTYPVARGVAPFFITVGGALALAQPLDAARVAGSLALGTGLLVISHAGLRQGRRIAVAFAVLTGVCIATYSVIDAGAVRSVSPIGYLGAVSLVQAAVLLVVVRPGRARLRAAAPAGAGIGIGSVAAYLLVLFAYQRAPVAPVATLRELSILIGILIAGERPGRRVWLGGAFCVLGATLVVL